MKQIALLCTLVLTLLLVSPALAQDTILISVSPFQGGPGTTVQVAGSGANPDQPVTVAMVPQPDSLAGALQTSTVNPNPDGTFDATLTVPASAASGTYYVRAEQTDATGTVVQFYWNVFTVVNGGSGVPPGDDAGDEDLIPPPTDLPVTGQTAPGSASPLLLSLGLLAVIALLGRGAYTVLQQ